jgi:hypothetical protein
MAGMSDIDYPGDESPRLSVRDAFDVARQFLEAYWERGSRSSDDIAVLLGSMNGIHDGRPLDPAQWSDWLDAVEKVEAGGRAQRR